MPALLEWKTANHHLERKQYADQANWNNQQMQTQEQIWATSDVKFLGISEIFEACDSLIYCSCEADWQKFHLFQ